MSDLKEIDLSTNNSYEENSSVYEISTSKSLDNRPRNYKKILEKRLKEQGFASSKSPSSRSSKGVSSKSTFTGSSNDSYDSGNSNAAGIFRDDNNSTHSRNNNNSTTGIAFPIENPKVPARQRNLHPRRGSCGDGDGGSSDDNNDDYTFNPKDAQIIPNISLRGLSISSSSTSGGTSIPHQRNNSTVASTSAVSADHKPNTCTIDDDMYIDDLYAEYKANVSWTNKMKALKRWRRFILTRIIPSILVLIGCIILIVHIQKKRVQYKLEHPPTLSPITYVPTAVPTSLPPFTDYPTSANKVYTSVRDLIHNNVYQVTERAATQISHYRTIKDGLIININIMHQGDTAVCGGIGKSPSVMNGTGTPTNICWGPKPIDNIPSDYPLTSPWHNSVTDTNVHIVRSKFHFIHWDFSKEVTPYNPSLIDTDWTNPKIVSILIVRHPLERMFHPDGKLGKKYPNIFHNGNPNETEWWDFAQCTETDNFQLRLLSGQLYEDVENNRTQKLPSCCTGNTTNRIYLYNAKQLLRKITFIVDYRCLTESINAITGILNITSIGRYTNPDGRPNYNETVSTIEHRINNYHIYKYILDRNALDIELYDWAKQRAIVKCNSLIGSSY